MNQPESLTHVETRIRTALATITRAWPQTRNPPQTPGRRTGRPSSRPPCNETALSQRAETTHNLAFWIHALASEVDQLWGHQTATGWVDQTVDCRDVPMMCAVLTRHARWISGWEYAPRLLNELETHARELRRTAWPPQRDTLAIGECPLTPNGEGLQPCGGQIRVKRDEDWAVCRNCKTGAVVAWWRQRIPTPDQVTASRLTLLLAIDTGVILTEAAIRQRHKRGQIRSTGRDSKGRKLYPWREIVAAELDRQQTGQTCDIVTAGGKQPCPNTPRGEAASSPPGHPRTNK